jgi:hypothetical protein
MSLSRLKLKHRMRQAGGPIDVAPVISVETAVTINEGQHLALPLDANQDVEWSLSGVDAAQFDVQNAQTLIWVGNKVQDFDVPLDNNLNNVYRVVVTATNGTGLTDDETIEVTVADVTADVPGTPTLTVTTVSESEVLITTSATGADTYEYEIDDSAIWDLVPGDGLVRGLDESTLYSVKTRGRNAAGALGPESVADTATTDATPPVYNPAKMRFAVGPPANYLTRGAVPTGLTDGKAFTIAVRCTREAENSIMRLFSNGGNNFTLRYNSNNALELLGQDALGVTAVQAITTPTYAVGTTQQIMISVDAATDSLEFWVNGAQPALGTRVLVDTNIDMASSNWSVGAATNGGSPFVGIMEDFFFDDSFIDFSDPINRRKFRGPLGGLRDPGATGSNPLGAAPIICLHGDGSTWHTNDGTGGGFTLNGALEWVNGGTVTGLPTEQADHFVEHVSIQLHVERTGTTHSGQGASGNLADWSTTAWRQPFIDLGVRHGRSRIGNDALSLAHCTALYNATGIKIVTNVSVYHQGTDRTLQGRLDTAATLRCLQSLEELGLEKIQAIEGPNEYTYDRKYFRAYTVDPDTDVFTCTGGHGFAVNDRITFQRIDDEGVVNPDWDTLGTLPGGVLETPQNYWVITTPTSSTFKCSLTQGGASINVTSTGSGTRLVTNWVQRCYEIQQYIYNYARTRPTWNNVDVIAPSLWQRHVEDHLALGDLTSIADIAHLHYYQANRRPSRYNKSEDGVGENLMEEAIFDAAVNVTGGLTYVGETAFDIATPEDPALIGLSGAVGEYSGNTDMPVSISLNSDTWTTAVAHPFNQNVPAGMRQACRDANGVFISGKRVYFYSSGSLPTGIVPFQLYYVLSAGLTNTTFKVSSTIGGAPIVVAGPQSGTHRVGFAMFWSGDLATPDLVSKHALRLFAEFWNQGTIYKTNWYVFQDDHKINHYGLINRHSYDGTWTERNTYWSIRNLLSLMADPGVDFTPDDIDMSIVNPDEQNIRYNLFQKRNGTYLMQIWHDALSWRRSSPFGELTIAPQTVTINIDAPTIATVNVYEPTVLQRNGDTPTLGAFPQKPTPIATYSGAAAMNAINLSVNDHVMVVEMIPQ